MSTLAKPVRAPARTAAAGVPFGGSVSCLYAGRVRHRRHLAPGDVFEHRLFMAYLDLDELPGCLEGGRLASARRPALARFRRDDHLGNPAVGLAEAIRELVRERSGREADGPIRLLTQLRCYGHCFNPVSFYYCYDPPGEQVQTVIAEVTNTPWGERHAYVLPVGDSGRPGGARVLRGEVEKVLHVSPLMGMEQTYTWRLTEPGERLSVHIDSHDRDGECCFEATLALRRRPLHRGELARLLVRHPFPTVGVLAQIYRHALALRLRGAPYFAHPERAPAPR